MCANTAKVAECEGLANGSLRKFRHTQSANQRINEHLVDMAELKLGMAKHEDAMNDLAGCEVSVADVDGFLDAVYPIPAKEGRGQTIAENNRSAFLEIYEGVQSQTLVNPNTKYGLYQAYTDWSDHVKTSRNSDEASAKFDGIMGVRSADKAKVLKLLAA